MVPENRLVPGAIAQIGDHDTVRFARGRVERILGLSLGLACIVFGAQAALAATGSTDTGTWHLPIVIVTFTALAVMILTGVIGRFVRTGSAIFACTFAAVLLAWVFASAGRGADADVQPWIWYLINVATVAAVVAFPLPIAVAWTIAIPVGFAAVRIIQGGGTRDIWIGSIADTSFSIIFGFVLLILIWMFRSVADDVDAERERALSSYGRATAQEATEQERVEMAALMHDSVLSALIAASRAESPRERELSVMMTRDALTGLANAESDAVDVSDAPVSARVVAAEISDAVRGLGAEVVVPDPGDVPLPGRVARALSLAAIQAIANAVQHAGAAGLEVGFVATETSAVLTVRDSGPGIDVTKIPDDRLGLRASVFARMAAVGGVAELVTRRGGTTITLRWSR